MGSYQGNIKGKSVDVAILPPLNGGEFIVTPDFPLLSMPKNYVKLECFFRMACSIDNVRRSL